jgi:hypothetical protein
MQKAMTPPTLLQSGRKRMRIPVTLPEGSLRAAGDRESVRTAGDEHVEGAKVVGQEVGLRVYELDEEVK